jgi:hypothetical protein
LFLLLPNWTRLEFHFFSRLKFKFAPVSERRGDVTAASRFSRRTLWSALPHLDAVAGKKSGKN